MVGDARGDERFRQNPLVTGPVGIRAYAGWPVHLASREAVGTLCVFCRTPREFTQQELILLRDLAAWAELELRFDALPQTAQ